MTAHSAQRTASEKRTLRGLRPLAPQLCLQLHDGSCELEVRCVAKMVGNVDCSEDACDPACELAYCESPYQCGIRVACGDEVAGAFQCYGP